MFFSRIFKHLAPEALPPQEGAGAEVGSELVPPFFSGARIEELRKDIERLDMVENVKVSPL